MHRQHPEHEQCFPNGTYVEFDVEKYLSGEYAMGEMRKHKPRPKLEYPKIMIRLNPFTDHG
jgi:hypothetical protein